MTDPSRTNAELIEELSVLKQRTQELEHSESDRKQAEEALRESEERYHRIADTVTDYIFTSYIEDGKVVKTVHGPGCIAVTRYSAEEFAADPYLWFNMVFPEDRDRVEKYAARILTGKNLDPVEHRIRRKDGRVRWVQNTPVPHYDSSGALISYDGLISDITLRKRAEERLRESEEKFRTLYENAPVLIDGFDKNGRCILWNRECEKVFGWTMDEINSHDEPLALFYPDQDVRKQAIDTVTSKPEKIFREWHPLNRDGKELTALWANFQLPEGMVINIGYDITERKRAEADKEKLEAQNRQLQKAESLGRMAGAIAHTFNNQLGVVIGNLEMVLMDLPKGAAPVHSLTTAMRAANKAAEVSGQMLTYLGQSFDKLVLLDLADACRQNLPIFEASMPRTVTLETAFPSPGPAVMANATEIQQLLTNLITNAWEAVGPGRGKIYLSVKTVSPAEIPPSHRFPIGWQPQDSAYACLEVADTGDGIANSDIEKLFDPFFTSKFTGRGLGLPMILGIVKAHGGAVTVESEPGQGSTFRVFLPVSAEEVAKEPDKIQVNGDTLRQSVPIYSHGGTILLVEDEEMVRDIAAAMLKRLGYSVIEAKDGGEAVELFRQHRDEIRLVLSDLTMPRMDGWETLTALRQLAPDIPVILASGYDKAHVMAGDHPELPQVFLGKPYKLKGLGDAINQALVGGS